MIREADHTLDDASQGTHRTQARRSIDRRERLLQAATHILLKDGLQALTLEAVAREAGTSKGGLLHHFPSKAKLRGSLLDDVIASVHADLLGLAEANPERQGRRLRAYVHALVAPGDSGVRPVILAKLLYDPAALLRWRAFADDWLEPDTEGADPERIPTLRTLIDGCWLAFALGLGPADEVGRAATLRRLLQITMA